MTTQSDFDKIFDREYENKVPDLNQLLKIAVVGTVSTGKSSLINAIFERDETDIIAPVGARSGVTTTITEYPLGKRLVIYDCPGLDDVHEENSEKTKGLLYDIGIFVVTGSANASQKKNYSDIGQKAKKTFLVLNKIDDFDDKDESALEEVATQWKESLNATEIFLTCTKGYDPKRKKDASMDLRGIENLTKEIFSFSHEIGKSLLLVAQLKKKSSYANKIIITALTAVAAEAFIPGSAAYITATQVIAITSLYYTYTEEVLTKKSAIALLPTFFGQSVGTNLFLWAKSALPPTFIIDVAASGIAIVITFAMLAAVKTLLEKGYDLSDTKMLVEEFKKFRSIGENVLKDIPKKDSKGNKESLAMILQRLLSTR
jgi:ribosome biogenesis GTPase A